MSLLASLKPKAGSTHYQKRIGRGIGSGMGGTSTKGHKGQLARTGGTVRRGFEGGQTPLSRRLPKFGFTNAAFATQYQIINLSDLNKFDKSVDPEALYKMRLITKGSKIKVLAKGDLTKALAVKTHYISEKAKAAIEKAGGSVEVIK
ncbi:MAG: 50S ribosomal protein L15 [Bdellovibrionales bacterium RIFCSPHIGHO2_01_FULL_40_29]|nr:MAG: 50S ribosomal protein L15 [Bdellovibrionales bacterium RIFCSPHIGHO2_01_FULL_40_29]OFZ33902.1 MAG: 50S ribosomal protein L15 [Bdellovibrionales bacterium RIFCSPHIGHO2_02_FULL_40_15]